MKTVVIAEFGDATQLKITERPIPKIKSHEVLIKVAAAGLNRADIAQRKGHYPAPEGTVQYVLGLEVSGVIEKVGRDVDLWQVGQEVCALLPGGGYAEYVCIDQGSCLPIPKGFSLPEAASIPETLLTVWQNIFKIGHLQSDEKVLIYGGSGGIGSMAIQLANLFGAHALTVGSTPDKIAYCQRLGAQKVVNYKTQDLVGEFGRHSIELILDSVGGPYLDTNLELLKTEGRLVYINAMGGNAELNIFKMMQKRIHLTGSTLRSRTFDYKRSLIKDAVAQAYPMLESERFQKNIHHIFSVDEVVKAHQLMESRDFMGKILLAF